MSKAGKFLRKQADKAELIDCSKPCEFGASLLQSGRRDEEQEKSPGAKSADMEFGKQEPIRLVFY